MRSEGGGQSKGAKKKNEKTIFLQKTPKEGETIDGGNVRDNGT